MLACAVGLSACDKNAVQEDEITEPIEGYALVKFFHFGLNGPGVNFYANNTKVSAITSATGTESTTGVAFTGTAASGLYTALKPGQYTISGKIAAATDKDLAISSLPVTLAEGKRYSVYLSGLYNTTTKQQDSFIVEDVLPNVDYTVACVRFVNAIHNSSAMTLYARNTTTSEEIKLGDAVAYKAGGSFVCLPEGVYDLSTRTTGSTANAIARTGVTFLEGRVYTIAARGDMTVTGTTATNRPFLDNTANR